MLFSPDTWRVVIGIIVAYFLAPLILPPELPPAGIVLLYVMLAVIGYTGSRIPAGWITRAIKQLILGDKRP